MAVGSVSPKNLLDHLEELFSYSGPIAVSDVALNGLQVANSGKSISSVATAVDMSVALLEAIKGEPTDLIIVHHGLYWRERFAITGRHYKMIRDLLLRDIALVGMHLPLDVHPTLGNNVLLAKQLGLEFSSAFGDYKGTKILVEARKQEPSSFDGFVGCFAERVGKPLAVVSAGKHPVRRVGLCSGGGIFGIEQAHKQGCDTYVTGDASHAAYHLAKELGIHLVCGGHYNTEIWGVRALGDHLKERFELGHAFYDLPTQM